MTRDGTITHINACLLSMSEDELAVISMLVDRVDKARQVYGSLTFKNDQRSWAQELTEELVDATFYGAAALLQLRRSP